MAKKPAHIDTAMIERAVRFEATIFLGVGQYHTAGFERLEDAREAARQFAEVAKNGRRGMVYAITAEGRSTLVPDSYEPASTPQPEGLNVMETKLTGTEIARLTAVLNGETGYKRANSKEAAIARFLKVAAEKGIAADKAAAYLGHDFELAEHMVFERINGAASIPQVQAASPQPADQETAMEAAAEATTKPRKRNRAALETVAEARAEKAPKAPKADKPAAGKRAAILEAAQRGELPTPPDFSAETHKRFRPKLAAVVALVEAGAIEELEAFAINPVSSSPKAIAKYRDLAVIALKARASQGKAA